VLDYRAARDIQQRLEAIGVRCKVESLEQQAPAAFAARDPASAAQPRPEGEITCPKCGKVQPKALACTGCGVVFAKYQRPEPAAAAEPASARNAIAAPEPDKADTRERMMLYVGPRAERYMEKFARFEGVGFAPGWNWAAFFGGVVWTAYRKMWLWLAVQVAVVALTFFFIPFLGGLFHLGFVISADYLYYRQVQRKLGQLTEVSDEAVAAAGGGHMVAALVALFAPGILLLTFAFSMTGLLGGHAGEVQAAVNSDPQLAAIAKTPEGQATTLAFTMTSAAVYAWQEQGGDLRTIDTRSFLKDLNLPETALKDGWGTPLMVVPDTDGFIVLSAGPDGSFDSDDDIPIPFPAK